MTNRRPPNLTWVLVLLGAVGAVTLLAVAAIGVLSWCIRTFFN